MKKQVNPAIVAVIVVLVLGVAGFLFYKGTATPAPVNMSPQGPGAKFLKGGGPGMTPDVTEARKKMQQQQGGDTNK